MNRADAEDLAARITTTPGWHGQSIDEWVSALIGLDEDPAVNAYTRLRDTTTRAPSIADFRAAYRTALSPAGNIPRPENTGRPVALTDALASLDPCELARWPEWLRDRA